MKDKKRIDAKAKEPNKGMSSEKKSDFSSQKHASENKTEKKDYMRDDKKSPRDSQKGAKGCC